MTEGDPKVWIEKGIDRARRPVEGRSAFDRELSSAMPFTTAED